MTLSAGVTLSHYRILEKIGAGGMGEVYLAKDTKLDRSVAIKILPSELADDEERRNRFEKEAKAASAIDHPNVAHIYEIGESDGVRFIAMQYVAGETLAERMKTGAMTSEEIASIGAQVASALAASQAKGIVHRDIKPANLVLAGDDQVKVLDFGLAKTLSASALDEDSDAATRVKTDAGLVMGTVQYMSPEQALGSDVDTRSDIFSLGVVLYEMTARRLPFAGKTATETIEQIRHTQPEAVARFNYDAPPELERCIRKCLEKSADDRYQSAKDLHVDLRNINRDSGSGPVVATAKPPRRGSMPLAMAALLLLAVAGLGWLVWPNGSNNSEKVESLAVLPFENGSADPDGEYFSDGVTESIIMSLSQLPDVKVIARTSAFRYKGRTSDLEAIGRELGVEVLVLGRIIQREDALTISAELVRASDSEQLWGGRYEREAADVFAIQEELAREISDALRIQLTSEQEDRITKQHTESRAAYQSYSKGRHHWNLRTEDGLRQAIAHFRDAIREDPGYALAYSGLADSFSMLGLYFVSPVVFVDARQAAEQALELDSDLAEAHTSLGLIKVLQDWDLAGAERSFRRALELNPGYATSHHWLAARFFWTLDYDKGNQHMRRAQELDPVSMIINAEYGHYLGLSGRHEEALVQLDRALELDPDFAVLYHRQGAIHESLGSLTEAIQSYETAVQLSESAYLRSSLGHAYAVAGREEDARAVLATLMENSEVRYTRPAEIALVYAGLGENDRALDWLQTAFEDGARGLINHVSLRRTLDGDPRFTDLTRRFVPIE